MALQQIANTDISSTGTFALGSVSSSTLTSGRVTYATTGGLLTDSSSLTYNGTILTSAAFSGALNGTVGATTPSTVVATSVTNSGLTSGRITYASTGGLLVDSSNLTFSGTSFQVIGAVYVGNGQSSATFGGTTSAAGGTTDKDLTLSAWYPTSGTNDYGGDLYLSAGRAIGNGSGKLGSVYIKVGSAGATSSTAGSLVNAYVAQDTAQNWYISGTAKLTLNSTTLHTANGVNLSVGHTSTGGATFGVANGGNEIFQVFASFSSNLNLVQNYNYASSVYVANENRASLYSWKIGTTEAMRITSAGLVGIGTSSPSTYLTINGTDPLITLKNGDVNRWQFGLENTSSNRFVFYDNTASAYRLILDSDGDLGIGATNPLAKLHVKGSGTSGQVTSSFILENSSSGTGGMDITGSAGASRWRFLYGGGPSTGTNALTEAMCILTEGASAGNVGIGTGSPAGKFDITGASNGTVNSYLRAHGGTSARANMLIDMYTTTAGAAGTLTFQRAHSNTLGGTTDVSSGDALGYINFYGTSRGDGSYNSGGSIQVVVNGAASTYVPADMYIYTNSGSTDRSGSPQLTIHNNGNVGIGTISPNQLLTLGSSDGTQALSFVTSAYLGDDALIGNIEFSTHGADASYGNLANIKAYKTGTNTNSGDLSFWTKASGSSAQRMRITKDGVMYLGASLGNNFSFAYGGSVDISGSGTGLAGTATNLTLGAWNGPIIFQAGNSANALQERMRINSSGSLLVGTSTLPGSQSGRIFVGPYSANNGFGSFNYASPSGGTTTFQVGNSIAYRVTIFSTQSSTSGAIAQYVFVGLNKGAGYDPIVLTLGSTGSPGWTFSYALLSTSDTTVTVTDGGTNQGTRVFVEQLG